MNARVYTISGHVIDRATRVGIQALIVEAWDRDTRFHDMLGSTTTDADGAFWIGFDPEYFGDYGGDTSPDIFFRVYRDEQLILTTIDDPTMNAARGPHEVVLEIETGAVPVQGKDRVTLEQTFKVVNFFKQSDFAGVVREQRSKASMVGKFAGNLLQNGLTSFNFEPIKPTGAQSSEIVGQDTATAQINLARNQISVSDVKSYQPGANKESLTALTSAPLRLNANDTVTLYQENGIVRYYAVNKPQAAASVDSATVARIDGEVSTLKSNVNDLSSVRTDVATIKATFDREHAQLSDEVASVRTQVDEVSTLKSQLSELRQATADKDVQIETLQQEVTEMRAAQVDLSKRISPETINQIQEQLQALSKKIRGTPATPIAPAKPAKLAKPAKR